MKTLTQNEFHNHLGKLLDRVALGEHITITRNDKPVAILNPTSSILDLEPVSVGKVYKPLAKNDDLLDEMLNI